MSIGGINPTFRVNLPADTTKPLEEVFRKLATILSSIENGDVANSLEKKLNDYWNSLRVSKTAGANSVHFFNEFISELTEEWKRTPPDPKFAEEFRKSLNSAATGVGGGIGEAILTFAKNLEKELRDGFGDKALNAAKDMGNIGFNSLRISASGTSLLSAALSTIEGETKGMSVADSLFYAGKHYLPYVVVPMATATFLYKGAPLLAQYLYDKAFDDISKPKLTLKTKTITWTSQIKDYVSEKIWGPDKTNVPIFEKQLAEDIGEIIDVTKNIKKNKSYFQNVVLYGPGGTGKTMVAEMIAKESGLNYVMMSGGELGQYIKRKEHVGEFNRFWNSIKNSSYPTVVFIDEAESLCKDRKYLDAEHMELLNAFLARTGTEDKQVMIVLATNRIEDIDEAVLNRMTHKIHVKPPALLERIQILWKYILQFFTNEKERKELFTDEKVRQIASATDGCTGRSLFQIVNSIYAKKGATKDNKLTPQLVDKVVTRFVEQNKSLEEAKAAKAAPARETSTGDEMLEGPVDKKKK